MLIIKLMKRLFDLFVSIIGLVLLFPLFVIISVWIKLDSPGPFLYKQKRVGKANKDFVLYKFRSMTMGSQDMSLITIGRRDSRVTKSGYFIRKFKLDEIPQLINIFLGDMSLVGPRPEVRKYVELYNHEQLKVLSVLPGITDPASILYRNENELLGISNEPEKYYIEVIMPEKLQHSLDYINNRNFFSDIKVILITIIKIFK